MNPPIDLKKAHSWFAIELNNQSWTLLENQERTSEQDLELQYSANASAYHWSKVGSEINQARAASLVANAHAALGHGAAAKAQAERCLQVIDSKPEGVEDWDIAFAYDSLARALAAAGETEKSEEARAQAKASGDAIAEEGDRSFFFQWFGE